VDAPAGITPTYECTFEIDFGAGWFIGTGGFGNRVVGSVGGGTVTGERIRGTLVGPGADWALLGGDGYGRVDVRMQIRTHDAAMIYVQYVGLLEMNERSAPAMADRSKETTFDDQYFVTTPRMECGDERYEWVNTTIFVARGRLTRPGVCYEVYRV
jgi:hypothetical protein